MARPPKRTGGGKTYSVGLAGESNYQGAICVCREGEPVTVYHEIGNPYDDEALVVVSSRDETIGYIPRSNWLREVITEEGKGCEAWIKSINGEHEPMGVVIEVRLTEGELDSRDYKKASDSLAPSSGTGCLLALGSIPITLALGSLLGR